MNRDEEIVFTYLKKHYGDNVIFEPNTNCTPDFVINNIFAIEVRRLNQHYFHNNKSEGLEDIFFPIRESFDEVLMTFDKYYKGKTFYVGLSYRRPIQPDYKRIKKEMRLALSNFLELGDGKYPSEIRVNDQIEFDMMETEATMNRVFKPAGYGDQDAGGELITVYIENIRKCISDKSIQIHSHISEYDEWWLYLVDNLGWRLGAANLQKITSEINNLGEFTHLFILDRTGAELIISI
jgi:hypothetical protein